MFVWFELERCAFSFLQFSVDLNRLCSFISSCAANYLPAPFPVLGGQGGGEGAREGSRVGKGRALLLWHRHKGIPCSGMGPPPPSLSLCLAPRRTCVHTHSCLHGQRRGRLTGQTKTGRRWETERGRWDGGTGGHLWSSSARWRPRGRRPRKRSFFFFFFLNKHFSQVGAALCLSFLWRLSLTVYWFMPLGSTKALLCDFVFLSVLTRRSSTVRHFTLTSCNLLIRKNIHTELKSCSRRLLKALQQRHTEYRPDLRSAYCGLSES